MDRELKLLEQTKVEEITEVEKPVIRQTNPIAKKLTEFQHEKIGKFSVKDLFKS